MSAPTTAGSEGVNVGADGKPTNIRYQQNIFEKEEILTEKEKQRRELGSNGAAMKEKIKSMTAVDIFILFDEDDSGLIDFNEFRKMLPFLGISINDAKAYRYFRMCDTDGSGEIDIDEFRVALFTCDPTSGNSVGFVPNNNVTPLDAFETFDETGRGYLDEDEMHYSIDYLGIKTTDFILEDLFLEFDLDNTGTIDYEEFREIFLRLCDIRRELEERGVDVPAFSGRAALSKILRPILIEEENREKRALAEARRYKEWIMATRDKKKILQMAQFRSYYELRNSLDTGGHVYVFGLGSNNQFSAAACETMETKHFKFELFDKVLELWKDRIMPQQIIDRLHLQRKAQEQEEKRDAERSLGGIADVGALSAKKENTDPYKEALLSKFKDLNVAMNTAALWGRRIHHVAVSDSVIFALSDSGEVYSWGGNNFWWHEIQPDSMYQTKWRGDTTARSQLLLGTVGKQLPVDASVENDLNTMSPEDKKCEMIKEVSKYFNVWVPPPNFATRMLHMEKELMPKLLYDDIVFSMQCRGKEIMEGTKLELVEELHDSLVLEKKMLGARASRAIKELETQVAALQKRKKTKMADKILLRIKEMWLPLRDVQAEKKAEERSSALSLMHNAVMKTESNYVDWRKRIHESREQMNPTYTPRGNSLQLNLSGLTPRAQGLKTPRGYEAAIQMAAGSAHACLIHKNGHLYTWGVGTSGRLGLDLTEYGDPQKDSSTPKLVQALMGRPVIRISAGYSHTGCIVAGGELYMWGSTVTGKCGFGPEAVSEECYCSIPTRVFVGPENKRIRRLSCGGSHTGVITEGGHLYMFGCGDGGRLGLERGQYDPVVVPKLASCMLHEKIATVSCGCSTTIIATEIHRELKGGTDKIAPLNVLGGGRVYIAGSGNVFGKQYDVFTLLKDMEDLPVKVVSAGYHHSAIVTTEGELYTWGQNKGLCCGVIHSAKFIERPTSVECLFQLPRNIALNQKAYQSSTYHGREASFAVNGDTAGSGIKRATSTQQDGQAWLEVDLGTFATITEVLLWNRTDIPSDKALARDTYTSRLFPCWVMIGREPFSKDMNDALSLKNNLVQAVCKTRFTENKRLSKWSCPGSTQGRYVRVQLEGFSYLSVAQMEILGNFGFSGGVGRVSHAVAGRDVTVAVVRPNSDPRDVEASYKRAAYADAANADILRQFETYALEYDKFGRGEVLSNQCIICQGGDICEICKMYELYEDEIDCMQPGIGGRRRRLDSVENFLLLENKPTIKPIPVAQKDRPTKWALRKKRWWEAVVDPFQLYFKKETPMTTEEALEMNPDALLASFQQREDELFGSTVQESQSTKKPPKRRKNKNAARRAKIANAERDLGTANITTLWDPNNPNAENSNTISSGTLEATRSQSADRTGTANSYSTASTASRSSIPSGAGGRRKKRDKPVGSTTVMRDGREHTSMAFVEPGSSAGGLSGTAGSMARSFLDSAGLGGGTGTAKFRLPVMPWGNAPDAPPPPDSFPKDMRDKFALPPIGEKPMEGGFALPTGHKIRNPFPTVMDKKAKETAGLVQDTKDKEAAEAAKRKQEKYRQDALRL